MANRNVMERVRAELPSDTARMARLKASWHCDFQYYCQKFTGKGEKQRLKTTSMRVRPPADLMA